EHGFAVEEIIAGQDDLACGRRLDGRACGRGEVQPRMGVAGLAVEYPTKAERAGQSARHGAIQEYVAGRAGTEHAVGLRLLGQFALDAREVLRLGIDLAGVLEGDVLLFIGLGRYLEIDLPGLPGILDQHTLRPR